VGHGQLNRGKKIGENISGISSQNNHIYQTKGGEGINLLRESLSHQKVLIKKKKMHFFQGVYGKNLGDNRMGNGSIEWRRKRRRNRSSRVRKGERGGPPFSSSGEGALLTGKKIYSWDAKARKERKISGEIESLPVWT